MDRRFFLKRLPFVAPAAVATSKAGPGPGVYSMPDPVCHCGYMMRFNGPITVHHTITAFCVNGKCKDYMQGRIVLLNKLETT